MPKDSLSEWYDCDKSHTGNIESADNITIVTKSSLEGVPVISDRGSIEDDYKKLGYSKAINLVGLIQLIRVKADDYLKSLSEDSTEDLSLSQIKRKKDLEIIVDELSKVISEL